MLDHHRRRNQWLDYTLNFMQVQFRPVTAADLDFLDCMHTLCMKEHVERIYPWNPNLFRQTFNPQFIQVILVDVEVGMLQLAQHDKELYLGNLLVLPEFQNRGIGSVTLQNVLNRGQGLNLPVRLRVLRQNPAKHFYQRLGFVVIEETSTHYIMQSAKCASNNNSERRL